MFCKAQFLSLALCALVIACASVPIQTAENDDPIEVVLGKSGKKARVELSGGATYTFELIQISDSRCPNNAKCIWRGELAALLQIAREDDESSEREITLGKETQPTSDFAGARLSLVAIDEKTVTFSVVRIDQQ